MATIIRNYLWADSTPTVINLWNDIRTMPGVKQVVGDDGDMMVKIDDHVYLEFVDWNTSGTSNQRKIYVRYNDVATQIYSEQSTGWSPTQRMYQLVKSKNNDWTLQVGVGDYTKTSFTDVSAIFAVINVKNTVSDEVGYGIYVPRSIRQYRNVVANNTPKYLITEDVTQDVPNNESGSSTALSYIISSYASLTTLIPICGLSSQCISTTAQVMMIGQYPIYGDAEINNHKYFCLDGFCMLDE